MVELRGVNGKASKGYWRMNVVEEGGHPFIFEAPRHIESEVFLLF